MLKRTRDRLNGAHDDERGFTLIELLVVILIIGILAAIALPTFLGQQKKAQDASAKSTARNAVTQVESCLAEATDASASACGTAANKGLAALGPKVAVSGASVAGGDPVFTIVATSASGKTFTIVKGATGNLTYTTTADDARWIQNSTA